MLQRLITLSLIGCASISVTWAQGIILNNKELRADLNWLNQQGVINISTSTWPLSGDEVERALSQANISTPAQQKVINAVLNAIKADNNPVKVGLFVESAEKNIPQAFGDAQKAQYQANLELNAGSENWDGKLRVNAEKDLQIDNSEDVNVEGSYLAGKVWNQWLIAGQIPTWWGPSHDGSLIRGDASRPVYGLTVQRAVQNAFETKWLSWIGPWQYQAFAGQLKDYKAVPDAKLLGLRLTARPLPYLELGASRTIQWGGDGRSQSLSNLWEAIKGNDNFDDADLDKSNQLAGLDARLSLNHWFNIPVDVYGQFVGEDEAGLLPSRKLYLGGIDFSSSYKNMPYQLYAEWAETKTNGEVWGYSYYHRIYSDGYYQQGYPLGHAIGGDGEMYSVGGHIRFDPMNRLDGRVLYTKVNQSNLSINHAFPESDKIKALDITWSHYLKPDVPLKINGWISDSDLNGNDSGVSVGVEFPLDLKALGLH
ncbi:MAG: capsule assembly Wzi family protein [Acinetobacter populi]|uniref:capsule assembly Wzi family protein n=1 Tax=Acinetobacter populi TaxID=1582270 RepID=UPI0023551D61|nr:capsule assembly Wzi family protein [Acinetobacter populi]MCH4248687.1 capsule assembly Wzi family protein [Acinetobacter populi]